MLIKTIDSTKIYELELLCFKEPYSINVINCIIKSHECFLISYENNIVGYVIMLKTDASYELIKIAIIEKMRNKSIAKLALEEFINHHKTNIYLEVSKNNIYAIKLYESIGFKKINIRKNYYKDNSDAIIMLYEN